MIHPQHSVKRYWDIFVLLITVVAGVEVPLRLSLNYPLTGVILFADWAFTVIFAIDIALHFVTAIEVRAKIIHNRKMIRNQYIKGWFFIDLLATIPFDIILGSVFPFNLHYLRILRIFRLTRMLRLAKLTKVMQKTHSAHVLNPSLLRLCFFFFWIILIAHWVSCGWILLHNYPQSFSSEHIYLKAIYWTITTLTTVGYGDITPQSGWQTVYTMFIMILGVGVYGYVIGNIAGLLSNMDVARAAFMKKMEGLTAFFKYRDIPHTLQMQIREYYTHLWEHRMGYDESSIIHDLPPSLRASVTLHLNKEIIQKVPFFKNANDILIKDIVTHLKPQMFTPGDYIIHKGEVGQKMYFISAGDAEVLDEEKEDVFAHLHEGNYFGEMALFLDMPRTASIRATDYCDVYTLDKESFDIILKKYPIFAKEVKKTVEERLKRMKTQHRL